MLEHLCSSSQNEVKHNLASILISFVCVTQRQTPLFTSSCWMPARQQTQARENVLSCQEAEVCWNSLSSCSDKTQVNG